MLNTNQKANQKAKPKQNKKPKQNEGKIANKKLKKTRIVGGVDSSEDLKQNLNTVLKRLEGSYSISFGDILKNTNDNKLLIAAIQKYENAGYTQEHKDANMRAVKEALVLLLKKNTSSTEQKKEQSQDVIELSPDENETLQEEITLSLSENPTEPDASTGYEKFKSFVEMFTKNINLPPPSNYRETQESKTFKEHIYRIYTDGIVLLTISRTESAVANVYKADKNVSKYETLDNIVKFLMESKDCLIIVNRTKTNDNYVYDCMLQILSKLVKILLASDNLQKYIDEYLNKKVANPVNSKELITRDNYLNKLIKKIYQNLKDETITDTYTIKKHKVLLRSLIFIIYGAAKNINETTFKTVKAAYIKEFASNTALYNILNNFAYADVVDINMVGQAFYFPLNCMSDSMIKSFQHILNVMSSSSSSNSISEDDKNILIKLSDGLLTSDCEKTINNIIKTKSYILSEPLIMSEDIKRKLSKDISTEEIGSVHKYLIRFKNKIVDIKSIVEDENTKEALIKIYTDLKDKITKENKSFKNSFVSNIEELHPKTIAADT